MKYRTQRLVLKIVILLVVFEVIFDLILARGLIGPFLSSLTGANVLLVILILSGLAAGAVSDFLFDGSGLRGLNTSSITSQPSQ